MSQLRIIQAPYRSGPGPFDEAADLHIASIHHGVLPDLGRAFLSRLYREINRTAQAGVWVAVDSQRVVGFVAGCADPRRCYRTVLARAGLPLTLLAGRSLLRRSVLGRLSTVLSYPFRRGDRAESGAESGAEAGAESGAEAGSAELLAIAVDPQVRGQGVGRGLVEAFEEGLLSWGVRGRYRVATNVEEEVSNRFYEQTGFVPAYRTSHNDLTLQIYFKTLPEEV